MGSIAILPIGLVEQILRAMLDYAQQKEYFTNLKEGEVSAPEVRINSFVRLALTILHNVGEPIKLSKLMQTLFQKPYIGSGLNLDDKTFEELGSILFLMNELKNSNINWTNLLVLHYPSTKTYSRVELTNAIKKAAKESQEGEYNIDLIIAPAGELFLQFCPEFEFFACIFASEYPALVSNANIQERTIKGKAVRFPCLELIFTVRNKAEQFIQHIVKADDKFYSYGSGMGGIGKFRPMHDGRYKWIFASKTHLQRILDCHIGYLGDYFLHVHEADLSLFLTNKDKYILLKGIYDELNLYWKFYEQTTKDNLGYFRGFRPIRARYRQMMQIDKIMVTA